MEMEDGGRREVMAAMEVICEMEKVKKMKMKMKMKLREFGEERESESGRIFSKVKLVGIK